MSTTSAGARSRRCLVRGRRPEGGRCLKSWIVLDENLPKRLLTELRGRGFDEITSVYELQFAGQKDPDVLASLAAMEYPSVLVTFDNKLPFEQAELIRSGPIAVAVIESSAPRDVGFDAYLRDMVHRHAHRFADQPPGTAYRYRGARRYKIRLS